MSQIDLKTLKPGDAIPSLSLPPLKRSTLALFAGASGDHNPIHIDIDFARASGMEDVFAHGMLGMAYMSRLLTAIAPVEAIRRFGTKFASITQIHAQLTCEGLVDKVEQEDGEVRVSLTLVVRDEHNDVKLQGYAVIAL